MNWRRRRDPDDAVRTAIEAEVDAHEAVHAAEQVVSAAWVTQLLHSEQGARDAVRACTQMRSAAATVLHQARVTGDARLIRYAQAELTHQEEALRHCTQVCEAVSAKVAAELDAWAAATRGRVAESLADRSRLAEARGLLGAWRRPEDRCPEDD